VPQQPLSLRSTAVTRSDLAMSVAIVSFNTRDVLADCVASVLAAGPERVVVVDNASSDGTVEMLRDRFPGVDVIANAHNRGYGAAANQGVAACETSAVLILNSDARISSDSLDRLTDYLVTHPSAAVVGPRLSNPDGTLQRSTFPFPCALDVVMAETGLHLLVGRLPWVRDWFLRTWSHDAARRVPWVLGAALAIRTSAFDAVNGFDESYFLYSEEVDLCRRFASAGYEVHYAPVTSVVHLGGESTRAAADGMLHERFASRVRYLRSHESRAKAMRALVSLEIVVVGRLLRDGIRMCIPRGDERRQVRASFELWRTLLADRALWRA